MREVGVEQRVLQRQLVVLRFRPVQQPVRVEGVVDTARSSRRHGEAHGGGGLADRVPGGGRLFRRGPVLAGHVLGHVLAFGRHVGLSSKGWSVSWASTSPLSRSNAISSPRRPTTHQGQTTSDTTSMTSFLGMDASWRGTLGRLAARGDPGDARAVAQGVFITFEGGEGAGKSTQVLRLSHRLARGGREVVTTREPGGSPGAEALRQLLVRGEADRWSPLSELLILYAAREDHLERTIRPALARGAIVVSDRFADSSRAYQGAGGGLEHAFIATLEARTLGAARPDLTLIFDLPVEEGLARAAARGGAETRVRGQGPGLPPAPARRFPRNRRRRAPPLRRDRRRPPDRRRDNRHGRRRRRKARPVSDDRPQRDRFEPLDGVESQAQAFEAGLAADRLHHAWLLAGPQGLGKAGFAFRAARRLLGAAPDPAAGPLGSAQGDRVNRLVSARSHPDLLVLQREVEDGKPRRNIPVDEARLLPEFFSKAPAIACWRVALIDAADDLNVNAANAVLKTLEEPPARACCCSSATRRGGSCPPSAPAAAGWRSGRGPSRRWPPGCATAAWTTRTAGRRRRGARRAAPLQAGRAARRTLWPYSPRFPALTPPGS